MNALYTVAEIREIEQSAKSDLPEGCLMQRAGQAAAKMALSLLQIPPGHARILVLAGPGDNGGDALETACRLALSSLQVTVLLYADAGRQSAEALQALQRAQASPARFADPGSIADATSTIKSTRWTLIIDGLFGIGLKREITGDLAGLIGTVNTFSCPVLALDIPSGLDADSGDIIGGRGAAVRASHTLTFIGNKPGLHTCHGRDYAGKVQVARLDIESRHFKAPRARLNGVDLFAGHLRQRAQNSHKGTYGSLAVVGGASGMGGAPVLAARAASQCGTGRVFIAFQGVAPAYDSKQPELMFRQADTFDFASACLVVGPGMGVGPPAHELLARALEPPSPLVLDADALNLLATDAALQNILSRRQGNLILTPHPLEAARLLGLSSAEVQANRPQAARTLARQFNAIVVLKGSGSIIAGANDRIVINTTGNPALATAGTGDVLAGICGALLAQGWPAWEAALAAVWMHGSAADKLVEQEVGPIGMTAGELIPAVRKILNRLVLQQAHERLQ